MSKILCFIPAKGNSKELKNKNIKKIYNKTLIKITIELAKKSKLFYKIILSSDSKKIIEMGDKLKIETHLRPKKISNSYSRTEEALNHSLSKLKKKPDGIIILQVTSPLRTLKTLNFFLKECLDKKYNNCLSVSLIKSQISKNNKFFSPFGDLSKRRRQDRQSYLTENSLFYFVSYRSFKKNISIYNKKWNYIITDKYESIDIDNKRDLEICQKLYKKN